MSLFQTRSGRTWPVSAVIVVAALVAFIVTWLLTRDQFVFTEARGYALFRLPLDPARWLALPVLDWGSGRLFGQLQFQLTGRLCSVDAGCFSIVGAAETAVAVAILVAHTYQLTRSMAIALLSAAFWVTSPALLGVSLWQAARFDLLVFSFMLGIAALWWQIAGREHLSRRWLAATIVGGLVLMNLALNTKETIYALVVTLPAIAVLRGVRFPGNIRRNLLLALPVLAYTAWFIAYGLTHMSASYAARTSSRSMVDGLVLLVRHGLGIDREFMYVQQTGDTVRALQSAAVLGFAALGVILVGLAVAAAVGSRRGRHPALEAAPATALDAVETTEADRPPDRGRGPAAAILAFGARRAVEPYLLVAVAVPMVMLARNDAPAAYYLLVPAWGVTVLLLLAVRELAARTPRPRLATGVTVGAWVVVHLLVFASLLVPGSTREQLLTGSDRLRDIGSTLRVTLQGRVPEAIAWRTLGIPPTDFFLLRSAALPRVKGTLGSQVGEDLPPYLLRDRGAFPEVTYLTEGSLEDLRTGRPDLSGPGQALVVIDDRYRLLLVRYEGRTLYEAEATVLRAGAAP